MSIIHNNKVEKGDDINPYIETMSETYIGGLVAYNIGTVNMVTSEIQITPASFGAVYNGGIVGYNGYGGSVSSCTNNGNISSSTGGNQIRY